MATMVVVVKRDFDGYKAGIKYSIEIGLAKRFVESGIAVPFSVHLEMMAEQKRMKEKAAADEAKKKMLLKEKEKKTRETADSKPAIKRTKSIKE